MSIQDKPASPCCRKTSLLHCKGTLVVDTKKKFQIFQVCVGSGRLWYYNPDSLVEPLEIISLQGATVKHGTSKDKGDADKHLFQATLEKDKTCKIHFSFDSAAECAEWISLVSELIEESQLTLFGTSVIDATKKTNRMVPTFIQYIISLLRPNLDTEGIFRLPGSQSVINDLKSKYLDGEEPNLSDCEVPTLASLLKVYFRELSTPIVPPSHVQKFFDAASLEDPEKFSSTLKELIKALPEPDRVTLAYLINFFRDVSAKSAQNKMEVPNISIATAPSLLRLPSSDKDSKQGGKDELAAATQGLRVVERMINDYQNIFGNEEDESIVNQKPFGEMPTKNPVDRPEYTVSEKAIVSATLQLHHEDFDACHFLRAFKCIPKSKNMEDCLIVVGSNRIYVFSHGKLDIDIPLIDLQEIISPSTASVTIMYGNTRIPNSPLNEFRFRPFTMAGWDIDVILMKIILNWQLLFVGAPNDTLKLSVVPEERLKTIQGQITPPDLLEGCGGFVKSYQAVSDYFNVPPLEDFIWDLENLFSNNYIRDFILSECCRKDKYPNDEFKCFMVCLAHNPWFTSIVADNQKLGNESALQLTQVFKTNRTITHLKMSNVGATSQVFVSLADNLLSNPLSALNWIDISQNSLDDKAVEKLGLSFEKLTSLVHLNVSGCGISKKAMPILLDNLHKHSAICASLTSLDVSNNSMDSVDASRQLGLVLGKVTALRELKMAGTQPLFLNILAAFEKSHLTFLNVSDTKLNAKLQDDFIDFLKRSPAIQNLILHNVNITPIQLNDILTTHPALKVLDISDNDLSDEGVLSLCDILLSRPDVAPQLAELYMDRMFPKRSKDRPQAMAQLANLLEARPISCLRMKGGPKSQLKTDLVPLVFGLINNETLTHLDVAGNQCGDGLPLAFAKILQHNHTLQTLYWDDNGTTMAGLRSFKIGLARNSSLRKMPLPVLDMANILKNETDLTAVVTISHEIQEIVFNNALAATHTKMSPQHPMATAQPAVSKAPAKKPIEAPRGRLASAMPTVSPGVKKGFMPPAGGPKKMAPIPATSLTVPQANNNGQSADNQTISPRGHSKSISKASVNRASLLFGTALPSLTDQNTSSTSPIPSTSLPNGGMVHSASAESVDPSKKPASKFGFAKASATPSK